MKKTLALFILLTHINTSMFFPVMEEKDVFDKNGIAQNDINTVIEFIDQEILGHEQTALPDPDGDDSIPYFHAVKFVEYCFAQPEMKLADKTNNETQANRSPLRNVQSWHSITLDIQVPPPKA